MMGRLGARIAAVLLGLGLDAGREVSASSTSPGVANQPEGGSRSASRRQCRRVSQLHDRQSPPRQWQTGSDAPASRVRTEFYWANLEQLREFSSSADTGDMPGADNSSAPRAMSASLARAPTQNGKPPRPDRCIYSVAADRLVALGFDANVRTINLDAEVKVSLVAVYVVPGDRRIQWVRGTPPAPVGFNYRSGERGDSGISLFSGHSDDEVTRFVDALSAAPLITAAPATWRPEWDPYSLAAAETGRVDSHMRMAAALACPVPSRRSESEECRRLEFR